MIDIINTGPTFGKTDTMASRPAILITGASSGIGATYAERFARRGHDLVLVARSTEKLEVNAASLQAETGVRVDILPADLTEAEDLAKVAARLREDASIGVLINNAGGNVGGGFLGQDADDLGRLIALNATSVLRLSHAAASAFVERGEGAIINVSSVLSLAPEFGTSVYTATKAFVLSLSQALQSELGSRDIYVQAVLPGATRTEIWKSADQSKLPPMMDVGELVDAALVGFDRREAITIPSLHDESRWSALEAARHAFMQDFGHDTAAGRYRQPA